MFKVKMVSNHIPNLIKRFKELEKSKFEVGYWNSQGKHNSGLSYPTIFTILSYGSTKINLPARPVLDLEFSTFSPLNKNVMLKNKLKMYFSDIKSKTPKISVTILMESVAEVYVEKTRNNFGNATVLADNSDFTQYLKSRAGLPPNSPLVWSGDLRDNLSYSINGGSPITPT